MKMKFISFCLFSFIFVFYIESVKFNPLLIRVKLELLKMQRAKEIKSCAYDIGVMKRSLKALYLGTRYGYHRPGGSIDFMTYLQRSQLSYTESLKKINNLDKQICTVLNKKNA